MAVLPTNHRPSAAEEKGRRRGRKGRPITVEEESEDRAAGTSNKVRIAAIADSPATSLCSATASVAVQVTKRRPSAAEEWNHRRRGRNGAAEEESKDRAPGRSDGRITAVADSYQMLKKIGEGAFGAVSKARHIQSGDIVAIKSSINPGDEKAPEALLREAAMLTVCAVNPAVVRLREVARGSDMHNLHLVMDYVGQSLSDVIRSRRRHGQQCSESEMRRAMAQLLDGISTMHAHGFTHRDLKPGNVLVDEKDGRLKICDLGLAKSVVTLPTDLEGTPGYMAPELLLSQNDCGEPVDMWALGCVMAEMSAGEPLFTAEDVCDQLISIVHLLGIPDDVSLMPLGVSPPSKLRERVPEEQLSPAGFNVLQGLLEYNPKDRLTAEDALNMPWFADKDDPKDKLTAEDTLNMPWFVQIKMIDR